MPVFVGPGSAPAGGFEGKSDRVGFNTATSDPGSAVIGDMYVQTVGAGATLRLYNGSTWANACQVAFSASGGNTEETVSGNVRHIFTGPGNFTVAAGSKNINILVVGGGGGGGQSQGNGQSAGGGAGGFRLVSSFPVSGPATYPITVGPAGSGSGTTPIAPVTTPNSSKDGGDSTFGSSPVITGTGGGGGGGYNGSQYTSGQPGGSGGGDGSEPQQPGSGNAGGNDPRSSPITEGFDGGNSEANSYGTGGGGAAQAGQGPGLSTGPGGIGAPVPTAIAPASTGTPGPSPGRYFAGGGGGSGAQPGSGGSGGGGAGGSTSAGSPGTTNTGGGGGGAQAPMGTLTGGDGGTGIVIVSYEA